ncbi:MAG: iron ABC transporter permease [Candidatus Hydrogenedentota bacterium]|nr:MAG: iron ABC transporter permease [Candidatus Hydrogenedentota bacterium]
MRIVAVLSLLLVALSFASLSFGSRTFSPSTVVNAVAEETGLVRETPLSPTERIVIARIRLPRTILALLVGAALGVSGVLMQGLFRNPLAEPGVIGISAGGGFAAVAVLASGVTSHLLVLPAAALLGSFLAAILAVFLASTGGRISIVTLLLSGIAVNTFFAAASSFVMIQSHTFLLRDILGWLMGSLEARGWNHVAVAAPFILLGVLPAPLLARSLDAMSLGEETALSLGVDTARLRLLVLLLTTAATGGAVAVSGTIAFVGIIVPHLARLTVGSPHRLLIPVSALGGASLLLAADLATRVFLPGQLRIGIVTAFLGVPFFAYLIRKSSRRTDYE